MAVVGQNLDHPALVDPAPLALGEHAFELGSKRGKPRDAALDVGEVSSGDLVGFVARPLWIIRKLQEIADGLDRKAEFARVADETQALPVASVIGAVVARRASRGGQKADPLVVADGLHLGRGRRRKIANSELLVRHGLDPVAATGSI